MTDAKVQGQKRASYWNYSPSLKIRIGQCEVWEYENYRGFNICHMNAFVSMWYGGGVAEMR